MKKTHTILAITAGLIVTLTSCTNPLIKDPRLYNPKPNVNATVPTAPEPELDLTGGVDQFDMLEEWYNKPDCNVDSNVENTISFPAEEFNNIQISGWFNNQNVPTYTMTSGSVWGGCTNEEKHEYVHSHAPNTEGQGFKISDVTYYQYRGKNPLYAGDGQYNSFLQETESGNPKLSRFYFYRFTGMGGGVQKLDNQLIAVDTYSKLIYAFGKPVEFSSMGAPTRWDPTDNKPFKDGTTYQFYMYDPVGYVQKTGEGKYEVVLYDWFKKALAGGNYDSTFNGFATTAKKTPDGQGSSPFNNHSIDLFVENLKLINNLTYNNRPSTAEFKYGPILHKYTLSNDGKTITESISEYGKTNVENGNIYTYKASSTATEGIFTDNSGKELNIEFSNKFNNMTLIDTDGNKITSSLSPDKGPDFLIRVRGKTFSGSGYTYTFSEDGKKVSFGDKSYTFSQQDDVDRAVYKANEIVYWGIKIQDNDTKITWTPTSWASASTTPSKLANSNPAFLKISEGACFADNVKNAKFEYREAAGYTGRDGKGYGLKLYKCIFDETGKQYSLSIENWDGTKEDLGTFNITSDNGKYNATSSDNKEIVLEEDLYVLHIGDKTFFRNFVDLGPSFENRLLGVRKFAKDNKSAVLSGGEHNIDTLVWTEPNWRGNKKSTSYRKCAQYDDTRDYIIYENNAKTWYYKLQVKGTTPDNVEIRMSKYGSGWLTIRNDNNMTEYLQANNK